jgi:hypothetical protein
LINDHFRGTVELYRVAADPGESRNVAEHEPETLETLMSHLDAWVAETEAKSTEIPRTPLTDEERTQLRALGYAD